MATQQDIATHLGLSLKGARNMLAKLQIDNKLVSLDYVRLKYIQSLDITGTERNGQLNITSERLKLMEAQRTKIKLETKKLRNTPRETPSQTWGLSVANHKDKQLASEILLEAAEQTDKLTASLQYTLDNFKYSEDEEYY